jgi:UDP-N-acetylglucosamine 2-epimerase (non-hydrolysing)
MMPDTRLKVMCIFGTRPEVIKMAPVIRELKRRSDRFAVRTCATAQHRDMLDQAAALWQITPDIDLDIMQAGQTLSQVAARVLMGLEPVLRQEQPDWVLVQGDTTTVMASALAAHHLQIKVGHVEAGLRTYDRQNPFPEEMNRVVADHVSDLCFAPTVRARDALLQEGIQAEQIIVTGNTVVDALLQTVAETWMPPPESLLAHVPWHRKVVMVTSHRRENFGQPLEMVCQALRDLARRDDVQVVYPVHPNPNVKQVVDELLVGIPQIILLPPLDYQELVYLMKRCYLVLTDSGGLQEEAPSLGKPVLVLRQVTERPEAIEAGVAKLVGTERAHIVSSVVQLLEDEAAYQSMARPANPYGDGQAAQRIADALLAWG